MPSSPVKPRGRGVAGAVLQSPSKSKAGALSQVSCAHSLITHFICDRYIFTFMAFICFIVQQKAGKDESKVEESHFEDAFRGYLVSKLTVEMRQ